jgi:hypothetical protein
MSAARQVQRVTIRTVGVQGARGPVGPKGDRGEIGPVGPAPTLSIGHVTTGTPAVTITGGDGAYSLDITLPAGVSSNWDFPTASASWVIDHGLDFAPGVSTVSADGHRMWGAVTHTPGRTVVEFSEPVAGTARLA